MYESNFREHLIKELNNIVEQNVYKKEVVLTKPQGVVTDVVLDGNVYTEALNFCANNYLGLANDPELIEAANSGLRHFGYGMASVRFICGTSQLHKNLEKKIAEFLGTEDAITYTSCFDANGGLFENLFTEQDAIISDQLNHASIIDGVRLCKAQRFRYNHSDMKDLEVRLNECANCRFKIVATDGVFSMDGDMANLKGICDLSDKYGALVMVDDSHGTGVIGKNGRGSAEYCGVTGRVDIITSTFGKALGGGVGGFTTGHKEIIEFLRQRSRPYLFSNALPPPNASAAIEALKILERQSPLSPFNKGGVGGLRERLEENTAYFRKRIKETGFKIKEGFHPIIPIMLYDPAVTQKMARRLLEERVFVVAFSFPVVPKGEDRIRIQISAAHTKEHLDFAIEKFEKVGKELRVI
ncbi:MAG TPA: glycine C-acetyltransferase [Candidatus Brocadiia bacterium]|nr:glycine C-acetyltransferase [Candidatus Brocadiales bacterium]